jgi:peptidoglycan/xylan/chitin deacetylase (PgdA/CDA1 family)
LTRPPLALAYHGVERVPLADDQYRLFTDPAALRKHLALLRKWGYSFVTFADLARRVAAGAGTNCVALTFDDGFSDNHSVLLPLLRDEGVTASVYVVAGDMGKPHHVVPWRRTLHPEEVVELHEGGLEVGSHCVEHVDLDTVPYEVALEQFVESKAVLSSLIGAPVETAAYPYGRASATVRQACRDAGYVAACRTSGNGSWDDPWNLPRQDMIAACTTLGLWLKRDDRYQPLVRTFPGRAARGIFHRAQKLVR